MARMRNDSVIVAGMYEDGRFRGDFDDLRFGCWFSFSLSSFELLVVLLLLLLLFILRFFRCLGFGRHDFVDVDDDELLLLVLDAVLHPLPLRLERVGFGESSLLLVFPLLVVLVVSSSSTAPRWCEALMRTKNKIFNFLV